MNKSIYTHQNSNIVKTYFLMFLFLIFISLIGYFLSVYFKSIEVLYLAIILSLVINFSSFWFSDKIALSLSKAREAKREEFFDLYTITENLAITAGLPKPKIFVIEDDAPNAFATGRDKNHSVIAVTTGLLNRLSKSELEGVVAHELSHIGNRDILLMSAVVVLVGLLSIVSDMILRNAFWGSGDREDNKNSGLFTIIGLVLIIISPIIATIIQFAISRKREFLADASAVMLTRYPEGLANALMKISEYNRPMKNTSTATAHLFISNPFGKKNSLKNLFSTHPPIEDRIKALLN